MLALIPSLPRISTRERHANDNHAPRENSTHTPFSSSVSSFRLLNDYPVSISAIRVKWEVVHALQLVARVIEGKRLHCSHSSSSPSSKPAAAPAPTAPAPAATPAAPTPQAQPALLHLDRTPCLDPWLYETHQKPGRPEQAPAVARRCVPSVAGRLLGSRAMGDMCLAVISPALQISRKICSDG